VAAAVGAFALVAVMLAIEIPSRHVPGDPGPRSVPVAAGVVVFLGAAAAAAVDARRPVAAAGRPEPSRSALLVAAATSAYLIAMAAVGFVAATALFLTGTSRYLDHGRRHPLAAHALVGVAAALALWLVFSRLLDVVLPRSPLGI
jgi:hypothetical protein